MSEISSNPFVVGDVVNLKSGSPRLTVSSVTETQVCVVWISYGPAEFFSAVLPWQALKKSDR